MFQITSAPVLSHVVVFFSSIAVLTANGQFVGCAFTVSSERYTDGLRSSSTGWGASAEFSVQD